MIPERQIRASFTDHSIRVYQAYPAEIAEPAATEGRFVAPFKRDRMTWIKPSFLWMAYRCGWATKPGQESVLAIDITRDGFEWALTNSCLSHFEIGTYESQDIWAQRLSVSPVRIQWDPERDELHRPLTHRSIQIGLTGEAARRYIDEWTVSITDVTNLFHRVGGEVELGNLAKAQALMPVEIVYPMTGDLIDTTGASLT
jgi:hypothetical protein